MKETETPTASGKENGGEGAETRGLLDAYYMKPLYLERSEFTVYPKIST